MNNLILSNNNVYRKIKSFLKDPKIIGFIDDIIYDELIVRMFYEYQNRLGHNRLIKINSWEKDLGEILIAVMKQYQLKICQNCQKLEKTFPLCKDCHEEYLIPCDQCEFYFPYNAIGNYQNGISSCKFCYENPGVRPQLKIPEFNHLFRSIVKFLDKEYGFIILKCCNCNLMYTISIKKLTKDKLCSSSTYHDPYNIDPLATFINDKTTYYDSKYLYQKNLFEYDNPCSCNGNVSANGLGEGLGYSKNIRNRYDIEYGKIYKKNKNKEFFCKNCQSKRKNKEHDNLMNLLKKMLEVTNSQPKPDLAINSNNSNILSHDILKAKSNIDMEIDDVNE